LLLLQAAITFMNIKTATIRVNNWQNSAIFICSHNSSSFFGVVPSCQKITCRGHGAGGFIFLQFDCRQFFPADWYSFFAGTVVPVSSTAG
jgi:hypothetical protein